jgi:hypothetical protein
MLFWLDPASLAGMPGADAKQAAALKAVGGIIGWTAGGTDSTSGGLYLDIPPAG